MFGCWIPSPKQLENQRRETVGAYSPEHPRNQALWYKVAPEAMILQEYGFLRGLWSIYTTVLLQKDLAYRLQFCGTFWSNRRSGPSPISTHAPRRPTHARPRAAVRRSGRRWQSRAPWNCQHEEEEGKGTSYIYMYIMHIYICIIHIFHIYIYVYTCFCLFIHYICTCMYICLRCRAYC